MAHDAGYSMPTGDLSCSGVIDAVPVTARDEPDYAMGYGLGSEHRHSKLLSFGASLSYWNHEIHLTVTDEGGATRFAGLHGAAAKLETPLGDTDANGSGFGFWAGGSVFWRLDERFNTGLDVRCNDANVDLDFGSGVVAQDVSAGGFQCGLLLGFGR